MLASIGASQHADVVPPEPLAVMALELILSCSILLFFYRPTELGRVFL